MTANFADISLVSETNKDPTKLAIARIIRELAQKAASGSAEMELPHVGTLLFRNQLAACRFHEDLAEDAREALGRRRRDSSPAYGSDLTPHKLQFLATQSGAKRKSGKSLTPLLKGSADNISVATPHTHTNGFFGKRRTQQNSIERSYADGNSYFGLGEQSLPLISENPYEEFLSKHKDLAGVGNSSLFHLLLEFKARILKKIAELQRDAGHTPLKVLKTIAEEDDEARPAHGNQPS